jgi:hypothetical protein
VDLTKMGIFNNAESNEFCYSYEGKLRIYHSSNIVVKNNLKKNYRDGTIGE